MKLSKKILDALNKQINAEFYSAYLYMSMASYFENSSLAGMAGWMKTQSQEEMMHGMKIYEYIISRGGRVELKAIPAPPNRWKSPKEVFMVSLKHEESVTKMINSLVSLSNKEKDPATFSFLQWFVTEQVEEEASVQSILDKFSLTDGGKNSLYLLDKELGTRSMAQEE